jgi:hypothetical protein
MATKTQVFVVTTALAAAYGLGEADFGSAVAAVPKTETPRVCTVAGPVAKTTAESFVVSQHCAQVNTDYGLSGDKVCTIADVKQAQLSWNNMQHPGDLVVCTDFELDGSFAAREPAE